MTAEVAAHDGWALCVHVGAGSDVSADARRRLRGVMSRALAAGAAALAAGESCFVAVQYAMVELERDECCNAGFGAALTEDGTVELDASIALDTGECAAVGAVPGVPHPTLLAAALLVRAADVRPGGLVAPRVLVGPAAKRQAERLGVAVCADEALVSPLAAARHARYRARLGGADARAELDADEHDTVGCVALDGAGRLCAAVSSGGIALRPCGRVGEAGAPGCGCWAAPGVAVSCTGQGEAIIRAGLARALGAALAVADEPASRARECVQREFVDVALSDSRACYADTRADPRRMAGAIVLLARPGEAAELVFVHSAPTMGLASLSSGMAKPHCMFSRVATGSVVAGGHVLPLGSAVQHER